MNKQMLKVIGVVILSYLVLSLIVIYAITPSTQLKVNGHTVDERIQHIQEQTEYYNLVTETMDISSKSMAAFNAIDLRHQEETVDFTPLTETINKTIEKLKQVIEYDTDTIKISNEDEGYLKSLVDSHTKLKKKLIELKQNMENINTQIQTLLIDRQNTTTSTIHIQSINKLYEAFGKVSETTGSIRSLFGDSQNIFQSITRMTLMQQNWEMQIDFSMKRVVGGIVFCCLLSIGMVFLVMKPRRFSMKQFYAKDSSE